MNKLLDSDWLRAVQFNCNTSASSQNRGNFFCVFLANRYAKARRCARGGAILPSQATRTSRSPRFRLCSPEIRKKLRLFCRIHQYKLHTVILDYDWRKNNEKFCRPMISCKAMTKILYENSEKTFSQLSAKKAGVKKHLPYFLRANIFMFVGFSGS